MASVRCGGKACDRPWLTAGLVELASCDTRKERALKIEASLKEIRALLELAEADAAEDGRSSEARRQRRETLARRVPRRLLDPYQLMLEIGRVPGVVAIERGACSGCYLRLPTMVEYRARRSPAIHRCAQCRRLLYAPELVLARP